MSDEQNANDQTKQQPTRPDRMMPVIVLPKGEVSPADIALLRENRFCVVEASNPDAVRFMEPPPNGYGEQEKAAIALCRYVMSNDRIGAHSWSKTELGSLLAQFFIRGSPLEQIKAVQPVRVSNRK